MGREERKVQGLDYPAPPGHSYIRTVENIVKKIVIFFRSVVQEYKAESFVIVFKLIAKGSPS